MTRPATRSRTPKGLLPSSLPTMVDLSSPPAPRRPKPLSPSAFRSRVRVETAFVIGQLIGHAQATHAAAKKKAASRKPKRTRNANARPIRANHCVRVNV
jgi:hypothetical protein